MVQYRFAKKADGTIVDAQKLVGSVCHGNELFCIGCGRDLIAKVNGTQRQPHFAHRAITTCSPETYLHRLGKHVFAEEFRASRESGDAFEIEIEHPVVCRKFQRELGTSCPLDRKHRKVHDLTAYYDQIVEETPSGEFVPDLLLSDSSGRSPSLFVEIAVTHLLSERKRSSGGRIIEIGLDSEDDLGVIRGRRLTPENARFVNFAPESEKLTDSECRCAERQTYAFVVLSNGKCYLDRSTAADLVSRARRQRGRVGYFRLFDLRHFTSETDFLPPAGEVFRHAVRQARHEGFRFKNCYLCRHQGDNYFGDEGKPIFCKRRFIRCNSNAAVDCDEFESRPLGDDHVQL